MIWNNDPCIMDCLIDGNNRARLICFKEILLTGCWSIWIHRNNIIFDNKALSIPECMRHFRETFTIIMHRDKPSLKEGMQQWIDTL